MKKINYKCDEVVYTEKLQNGLKVYLYPTNKTKNFYITVSTHFGAEVMKYKKDNNIYEVTKGSAHFLEHRVMDFTKNKDAMEKINEYGSIVNAYTTYNGTNYNIFGSNNILENMTLLFDRVFHANIKSIDVENERGIILEEYNMYYSDPYFLLHIKLYENMCNKTFLKYPVLGTKEGIEIVTSKELNRLYKDFYTPSNMFIVVTGNFNKEEVLDFIKDYTKDINGGYNVEVIKPKENINTCVSYEEMNLDVNEPKVIVGYKIKIPSDIKKERFKLILGMCLSNEFSGTGDAYLELNNKGIKRIGYGIEEIDPYIIIYFKASSNEGEEFINIVEKYLSNLKLNKSDLERKKRSNISTLITSFEDLIDVEDNITSEIFKYNKLNNKKEELINSITLKEINLVLKSIDLKNKSVFKIVK